MKGSAQTAVIAAVALAVLATGVAQAQEKPAHVPLEKNIGQVTATGPVPSLAVLNSDGATLTDGRLTLSGVGKTTIVFADRPVRAAGHVMTTQFIQQWDEGKDSFAVDPPNATISVLSDTPGDVDDAVVELTKPELKGDTLSFQVKVLQGEIGNSGPAALFIDWFAARDAYGGVAHFGGVDGVTVAHEGAYWHAPVVHGAWYGAPVARAAVAGAAVAGTAAAVGAATADAAAAATYPGFAYPPNCGHYPYLPCYP
ncbi:hypothetical protein L0V05_07495 [Tabrizicola sp. J26]|uniref:hypothetical protein n=1 Tax=Alitabrizicola rongguiensis TaxID=2909234 RepID=UPI001F163AEE|nr:hypothetical protein [Tabrizicola rongguiensis]MCF1708660.1 hypothetical protein [Tabrizicola rongguiensis]